jgi:hypothetical protein
MTGKGEDRAAGFAEQSVKASVEHPSQDTPDHQEHGDHMQSGRSLTGNDHDRPDSDHPKFEDRYKP